MHIHICPTEITAFMVMWDFMTVYAIHFKHIMMAQLHNAKCVVCNK